MTLINHVMTSDLAFRFLPRRLSHVETFFSKCRFETNEIFLPLPFFFCLKGEGGITSRYSGEELGESGGLGQGEGRREGEAECGRV